MKTIDEKQENALRGVIARTVKLAAPHSQRRTRKIALAISAMICASTNHEIVKR
jgi:hypothetical protein